jgi:hypothetical protein
LSHAHRNPLRTWIAALGLLPLLTGVPLAQSIIGLSPADIGDPLLLGKTVARDPGDFTLFGGGNDVWDTSDQCHFAYVRRTSDFDVRVRVEYLEPVHRWSKAGLMVRESLAADSRMVFNRVTPIGQTRFPTALPFGQNDSRFAFRSGFNDGRGLNGGQHEDGVGQPGYPSAWLRLRRSGNVIVGYTGFDGLHWTEQGRVDTARWAGGALDSTLLVGLAVTSHEDSSGNTARAEFRSFSVTPKLKVQIVQQPRDAVVQAGRVATFRVVVTGYDPVSFQWFRNGVPLPNATSDTLSWFATEADNGANFRVEVSNELNRELSQAAGLKVFPDTTPPQVVNATADETLIHLRLSFSEEVDLKAALEPTNYALDGGVLVRGVKLLDDRFPTVFQLTTTPLKPGATYHLTVRNVRDLAGNVVPAGNQTEARAWRFVPGYLRREVFFDIDGVLLADLGNSPKFPLFPDGVSFVKEFETPPNLADRYGVRLSGLLLPALTGDYRFYIASDDQSGLWLSSDESPASAQLICFEPQWNGWREWRMPASNPSGRNPEFPENVSFPFPLTEGRRYYVEALMKEGPVFDHLGVTWELVGRDPVPVNGDPPIDGKFLGTFADPRLLEDFEITGHPQSQSFTPGQDVFLNVTVATFVPVRYQWRLNGVPVPGATEPTLRLPLAPASAGGDYDVVVASATRFELSRQAKLTPLLKELPLADNFADRSFTSAASDEGLGANRGFTLEPGEPLHADKRGGRSAWLGWRAPADGIVTFTTAGSDFDTLLAVYVGPSLADLRRVAADDDDGGFRTSAVSFNARAGQEYSLAIDGFNAQAGQIVLSWSLTETAEFLPEITLQPPGLLISAGEALELRVDSTTPTPGATLGFQWFRNDREVAQAIGNVLQLPTLRPADVGLYRLRITSRLQLERILFSAPVDVQINTAGERDVAAFDKFGDVPGLGARPQGPMPQSAELARRRRPSAPPPARGYSGAQVFSPYGSTKQPGEPNHCGELGGVSRWFYYQPQADGWLTLDTTGSTFNTVLAVYTNTPDPTSLATDFESLGAVACDNTSAGDGGDRVTFLATANTIYHVAVDAVGGAAAIDADDFVTLNYSLAVAPRLVGLDTMTATEGTLLTFSVSVIDPNVPPETLTFALDAGAPTGAGIDSSSGVFTWTPGEEHGGNSYPITVRVTDNGVPVQQATKTFNVTVNEVNQPPTFTKGPDAQVGEDAGAQTFTAWATDLSGGPPGDVGVVLTFLASSDNPGLFSVPPAIAANGTLTFTPAPNAHGSATVSVSLKDDGGTANGGVDTSATQTFTLTVVPINDPPVLSPVSDFTIHAGTTLTVTLTATDIDEPSDTLTFELVAGPPTASLNSAAKTFTWTPTDTDAGSASTITLRVADNGTPSQEDTESFTITVVGRPNIQSVSAAAGTVSLTWSAIAGVGYRVQFKAALTDAIWSDLSGDVTATSGTATKTDATLGVATQRFYRIRVLP